MPVEVGLGGVATGRGETVTILSPREIASPYNDSPDLDWTDPLEREIQTLVPPEPRPSSEPVTDARNAVTSGWTLYLPPGAPVTSRDRVRVRGTVYPVRGEPAEWGARGVIVQAFRVEG